MANSTTFLTLPAHQLLGTQLVYAEKDVDFSLENVTSGNTLDVLNLPKGAVILSGGWYVKTTEAVVQFALAAPTHSLTIKSAAVMGVAGIAANAFLTASQRLTAADTMRVTVSAADCTAARVVFFAIYAVSDAGL
jgi:hypothetical protein